MTIGGMTAAPGQPAQALCKLPVASEDADNGADRGAHADSYHC